MTKPLMWKEKCRQMQKSEKASTAISAASSPANSHSARCQRGWRVAPTRSASQAIKSCGNDPQAASPMPPPSKYAITLTPRLTLHAASTMYAPESNSNGMNTSSHQATSNDLLVGLSSLICIKKEKKGGHATGGIVNAA